MAREPDWPPSSGAPWHTTSAAWRLRPGVPEFSVVTTVPSSTGRSDEPMARLAGLVGATRDRYRQLLRPNTSVANSRDPRDDRYLALHPLRGQAVLLLDDTWTTGAHAQSAAAALRAAGAPVVALWAIGRHFHRDQSAEHGEAAAVYYKRAREIGWDWDKCCLCDDRAP